MGKLQIEYAERKRRNRRMALRSLIGAVLNTQPKNKEDSVEQKSTYKNETK